MFRDDITVLDCTIRDGGLMNNWKFDDGFVRAVYRACVEAGVDYMEIGYRSSESAFSRQEHGPWRFCDDADLRRIVGDNRTDLKLSAMADIGRIADSDIPPKSESVLDMIRVACYIHQMAEAITLTEHCMDKGYEVSINLMAVSKAAERDLDKALDDIARSRVPNLYIVDSFGALDVEQVAALAAKYVKALPGRIIGFHGHNNQQLAFANTIEAIVHGCTMLDGSLLGIGRGAGNCPLELLLSFLRNPKFNLRPILEVIQEHLVPMQARIQWGYYIPYMITGILNQHPRNAMKWLKSEQKDDCVTFYDRMLSGEGVE